MEFKSSKQKYHNANYALYYLAHSEMTQLGIYFL
jgi:hypothetical protein